MGSRRVICGCRARHATAVLASVLGFVVMPSGLLAQQVPAEIAALYDEIRIAIEMEDTESIASHLTSLGRAQAAVGQGIIPDLNRIFGNRENLAAEVRFDDASVTADRAFTIVTWAISGKTTETQDPWNATMQRADILVRRGGRWEFLASDEVDADAFSKVSNGIFEDMRTGLRIQAPTQWRVVPLASLRSFVMAVSPDVTAWLTWLVTDLPGTFTADQLARSEHDALEKLGPTLGIEFRDTVMEPTTLAGRPAFGVSRTIVAADGIEARQCMAFLIIGSTLYVGGYSAVPPGAYEAVKRDVERSLAATQITGPEVSELPPEAGRVEGRKYINDTYGCEMTAPEGWEVRIAQGQFKIQVSMQPPQGESFISMGMADLPDPALTAEQAVLSDDNLSSQAFENHEVVRQGDTTVGTLPAYESVTRFKFGDHIRQRWRVYLVDEERLFFMFADVTPVEAWERLEELVGEAFQSFRIFEAQPPTDVP